MATSAINKIILSGIHPSSFEHPIDRTALEILRKTPGLDKLFKALASIGFERQVRLYFTADSLRISENQRPDIFHSFQEACRILDMPEPELFITQNPFPNAMAIGMSRYTIVLTSGLVDLMDPDELQFVIAHELGHIKSGHMLYRTMAIFLSIVGLVAARNLPIVNILSDVLMYALYDWSRKSELTADRAGLLGVQDGDVAVRSLMKLAGGGSNDITSASIAEFLNQADDYEDMDSSVINVFYKFQMTRYQTHPFPALRAREVDSWSKSDGYADIIRGEYRKNDDFESERRCRACGAANSNPTFKFCTDCGKPL